jgi:hypothetical protein
VPETVATDNLSVMACIAGLGGTDFDSGSRLAMEDERERTGWIVGVPGVALISGELELDAAVARSEGGLRIWDTEMADGLASSTNGLGLEGVGELSSNDSLLAERST